MPSHVHRCQRRSRHIDTRTNETFLDQLRRVSAGNSLHLLGRIFLRIEAHATLCAAKRNIHDGALVGHQRGESHYLVGADHFAETNAAFDGRDVLAVFGAPALEDFVMPVFKTDGKLEVAQVIAGLDSDGEVRDEFSGILRRCRTAGRRFG
jgi:hypothetical protein